MEETRRITNANNRQDDHACYRIARRLSFSLCPIKTSKQISQSSITSEYLRRNKYIDKRENQVLLLGLILMVLAVVLLVIRIYSSLLLGTKPNYVILFVAIVIGVIAIHYLDKYLEGRYLKHLLASKKLTAILDKNGFAKLNEVYHERLINGYLWSIYIDRNICIDVYCDCSQLQKDDIKRIEYQGLIVMHNSLRKELSGWFGKMKISKLVEYLNLQSRLVHEYDLDPIKKELLDTDEYWT